MARTLTISLFLSTALFACDIEEETYDTGSAGTGDEGGDDAGTDDGGDDGGTDDGGTDDGGDDGGTDDGGTDDGGDDGGTDDGGDDGGTDATCRFRLGSMATSEEPLFFVIADVQETSVTELTSLEQAYFGTVSSYLPVDVGTWTLLLGDDVLAPAYSQPFVCEEGKSYTFLTTGAWSNYDPLGDDFKVFTLELPTDTSDLAADHVRATLVNAIAGDDEGIYSQMIYSGMVGSEDYVDFYVENDNAMLFRGEFVTTDLKVQADTAGFVTQYGVPSIYWTMFEADRMLSEANGQAAAIVVGCKDGCTTASDVATFVWWDDADGAKQIEMTLSTSM